MVRAHGAEEAAVRDASAVEEVTSGVDHEVDVVHPQAGAQEGSRHSLRDEIDVLAIGPGRAQHRLGAAHHGHAVTGRG